MRQTVTALLAAALVLLPTGVAAQTDEDPANPAQAEDAPAPAGPLNVTPLGIVRTDTDRARQAVLDTPSPAPDVLPGFFDAGAPAQAFLPVSAVLNLDTTRYLYAYDCPTGECQGFALDVWQALGPDQQRAYLSDIVAGLQAAVPGHMKYQAAAQGGRRDPDGRIVRVLAWLRVDGGQATFTGI